MIDDPLPSDARALLAAGRDRLGPDAATIARLRARVDAAVVIGVSATAASATAATSAPASTSASAATVSVAAKSLAVKLVLVLAVGTSAYIAHDVATRPSEQRDLVPPPPAMPNAAADEGAEIRPATVLAVAEPAPVAPAPAVIETPAARPPAPAPANEPSHATLAREIELVDRATVALRAGNLDIALAALRTYGAETAGAGQLAQDAEALRIEVLCRTHDATADAELGEFDKRWPHSAQRAHLTTVCTEESK